MTLKDSRPGRQQTDESLAGERVRTDHLVEEKSAIEEGSDLRIRRARELADGALAIARAASDEQLRDLGATEQVFATIARERLHATQLLIEERASAHETLERERAATGHALARLLPLRRGETDQHLMTERARSDEALAQRDDFLGMVNHDLRNLLHGIMLNADFIADTTPVDEDGQRVAKGARRIQRSVERMNRLIEDLVDVTSIDTGRLVIVPTIANAATAVREAVETWGPPALTKGLVLEAVATEPVFASFDANRILQVLGNLITNAVKFSTRDGTIALGVEAVGPDARFSVRDSGIGIPSDKLDAIFEKFWQVGSNDRRGLGLGLYISKCLVQAHGGKIWAESKPGAGSTFYFTVPAAN